MYKVIKLFADLQDGEHVYNVGDEYPRKGVTVTDERIAELAGSNNKQGCPLIELIKEEKPAAEEEKPAAPKAKKATK
jgi:transcription initiation factor IIE alpha subunit